MEEGPQETDEDDDDADSDFKEADDLADDLPHENNDIGGRPDLRMLHQPPINDRSGKKSTNHDSMQSIESASQKTKQSQKLNSLHFIQ